MTSYIGNVFISQSMNLIYIMIHSCFSELSQDFGGCQPYFYCKYRTSCRMLLAVCVAQNIASKLPNINDIIRFRAFYANWLWTRGYKSGLHYKQVNFTDRYIIIFAQILLHVFRRHHHNNKSKNFLVTPTSPSLDRLLGANIWHIIHLQEKLMNSPSALEYTNKCQRKSGTSLLSKKNRWEYFSWGKL